MALEDGIRTIRMLADQRETEVQILQMLVDKEPPGTTNVVMRALVQVYERMVEDYEQIADALAIGEDDDAA